MLHTAKRKFRSPPGEENPEHYTEKTLMSAVGFIISKGATGRFLRRKIDW